MNSPFLCPSCNTSREPGDRYCKKCGTEFDSSPDADGQPEDRTAAAEQAKPELRLKTRSCPGCGFRMPNECFLCVHCGLDFRTGKRASTKIKRRWSLRAPMARLGAWVSFIVRLTVKTLIIAAVAASVCYFAHRVAENMGVCSSATSVATQRGSENTGDVQQVDGSLPAPPDNYTILYNSKRDEFVAPETNQFVRLELRAGGHMQGRLVEISTNAVTIEQDGMVVGCLRHALAPATRIRFFGEDYAKYYATLATASNGITKTVGVVSPLRYFHDKLVCPCCRGERYYMIYRKPAGPSIREACPVCINRGEKVLERPCGTLLCPDCGGWGRLWHHDAKKEMRLTRPCTRCAAKGYLIPAPGAGQYPTDQPLPGVPTTPPEAPTTPPEAPPWWLPFVQVLDSFWHTGVDWLKVRMPLFISPSLTK